MLCSITMDDHSSVTELRTGALSHKGPPPRAAETIAKARALRAEHARAAAYQARRAEQARAAANHKEAARWTEGYRCSVARCRLLGDVIREESSRSPAGATASTVTPLTTRKAAQDIPTPGDPTPGEAA
jgi:hypothetical protein